MDVKNSAAPKPVGRPPLNPDERWEVSKERFEKSLTPAYRAPDDDSHWHSTMREVPIPNRRVRTQQFSWRLANPHSEWNEGDRVIVVCSDKQCVNPKHLVRVERPTEWTGAAKRAKRGQPHVMPALEDLEKMLVKLFTDNPMGTMAENQVERLQAMWQPEPLPLADDTTAPRIKVMMVVHPNFEDLPVGSRILIGTNFGVVFTEEDFK